MGIRRKRRKQHLDPEFDDLIRREEAMKTLQEWGDSEFGASEPRPNVRILSDAEWAIYQIKQVQEAEEHAGSNDARRSS